MNLLSVVCRVEMARDFAYIGVASFLYERCDGPVRSLGADSEGETSQNFLVLESVLKSEQCQIVRTYLICSFA